MKCPTPERIKAAERRHLPLVLQCKFLLLVAILFNDVVVLCQESSSGCRISVVELQSSSFDGTIPEPKDFESVHPFGHTLVLPNKDVDLEGCPPGRGVQKKAVRWDTTIAVEGDGGRGEGREEMGEVVDEEEFDRGVASTLSGLDVELEGEEVGEG